MEHVGAHNKVDLKKAKTTTHTYSSYVRLVVIVSNYNSLQWSSPTKYTCSKAREQSLFFHGRTINIVWTCVQVYDKTRIRNAAEIIICRPVDNNWSNLVKKLTGQTTC